MAIHTEICAAEPVCQLHVMIGSSEPIKILYEYFYTTASDSMFKFVLKQH